MVHAVDELPAPGTGRGGTVGEHGTQLFIEFRPGRMEAGSAGGAGFHVIEVGTDHFDEGEQRTGGHQKVVPEPETPLVFRFREQRFQFLQFGEAGVDHGDGLLLLGDDALASGGGPIGEDGPDAVQHLQVSVFPEHAENPARLDDLQIGVERELVEDQLMVDVLDPGDGFDAGLVHGDQGFAAGGWIVLLRILSADALRRGGRVKNSLFVGIEVDGISVEKAVAHPVQPDGVAVDALPLSGADVADDVFHVVGGEVSGAEEFAEAVALRTESQVIEAAQEGILGQERIEVVRRDLGLHLKGEVPGGQFRTGEDILVILRDGTEGAEDEMFTQLRMFLGEDADDLLHHLLGGINLRRGVVDGGEVRLGESQHDAVQFRDRLEGLGQFVAEQFLKGGAQQVEFAIGIHQFRDRLQRGGPHRHLAVPIVDGTVHSVGQLQDLPEFGPVSEDALPVERGGHRRIVLVEHQTVQSAQQRVAGGADLETVHLRIVRDLGNHFAHVLHVQRSRMHQRPGDLSFVIHRVVPF